VDPRIPGMGREEQTLPQAGLVQDKGQFFPLWLVDFFYTGSAELDLKFSVHGSQH
jgi:hypothetical protein